jgi:hypothetical protein
MVGSVRRTIIMGKTSKEPVVHPSHSHATDAAYHDVMNALSALYWQNATQLAMEAGCMPKDATRVLKVMLREDLVEQNGNTYRIAGYARGNDG